MYVYMHSYIPQYIDRVPTVYILKLRFCSPCNSILASIKSDRKKKHLWFSTNLKHNSLYYIQRNVCIILETKDENVFYKQANQIVLLGHADIWRLNSHSQQLWFACADWHLPQKLFCGLDHCWQFWKSCCLSIKISDFQIPIIRANILKCLQIQWCCMCEIIE